MPYSEGRTGKILDEDLISMDRIRVSKNSNFDLALIPSKTRFSRHYTYHKIVIYTTFLCFFESMKEYTCRFLRGHGFNPVFISIRIITFVLRTNDYNNNTGDEQQHNEEKCTPHNRGNCIFTLPVWYHDVNQKFNRIMVIWISCYLNWLSVA